MIVRLEVENLRGRFTAIGSMPEPEALAAADVIFSLGFCVRVVAPDRIVKQLLTDDHRGDAPPVRLVPVPKETPHD